MRLSLSALRRLTFWVGIALFVAGVLIFGATPRLASTAEQPPNYLGWGMFALAALTLAASVYFRLIEVRRADRKEAREIADRQRRSDDIN